MILTYRLSALALATLGVLGLSACEQTEERVAEDFISDDPTAGDGNGTFGGEDGDAADTGVGDEGGDPSGDGEVEISEADIVQIEGDRLYALSTYSGLTVVDMTNPDAMRSLGTWETDAEPFEMYVDAGQAFVMFNDFWVWDYDEALDEWNSQSSSRLVALDASDPAAIAVRGEFSLPGRIQDSRRVGDVLYVVTMQDGYCWGCDAEQKTVVTSLDISDEANPVIIDQLGFTALDQNWDWQRSVESTSERMYVASRTWAWEGLGSYIDVIDISAGDGTLVPGAQVQVTGGVFSRWQMNEHEGVLRVISQLGSEDPLIETFTVESAQSIVPLGSGTLTMPMPESLRSARFDGDRAYAITAEQTDPLFTIDLSDPANPQQVGELEIPGWVYHMEARGDDVLALGFDPGNPEGGINVSLFDVSVFDTPTLRRRVHFGGNWGSVPEDQNRIHKAFAILEDEQMVLVPHEGWSYDEGDTCSGNYQSGVQIIDWKDDDLSLRGLVPARGHARRALTHRERIVTVSDVQLATFDYADRDAPAARDNLALAVQVDDLVKADEVWVRMARDWWTSSQVLELVALADPTSLEPLGVIDLDLGESDECSWSWIEAVFAVGDHVFVVQSVENWDQNDYDTYSYSARVISVDIANPSAPVIDDMFEVPGQRVWGGQLANISTGSSWLIQHGEHLAVLTQDPDTSLSQVHVVDLSDPANLALSASLDRPAGQTQGELAVMSDTIVSWHTEPVAEIPGKVRFYFDRLDLSEATPQWATKVNVPGIIVAYDGDAGRAFTIDFELVQADLDWHACSAHPKYWNFEWTGDDSGVCTLITRSLEQLEIAGSQAFLVESHDIEGDAGIEQLYATDTRIFAKTDKSTWDQDDFEQHLDTKLVIVDIGSSNATIEEIDGESFGAYWWLSKVDDERAVMQLDYGKLGLVDSSEIAAPEITMSALPGWGGCYNPILDGDTVYCPMGMYGLESVEW